MFLKRTLLACSLALIFPALPSYAEVGTESGNTAQAENRVYGSVLPITWRRPGTTRLTTISISRPSPGTTVGLTTTRRSISTTSARGAGYGISRYDSDGDWHGIYIMAFKDSFNKWEPIGGYAYEKIWRPLDDKDFRLGLGFTASVTARDNWKYIPIPAPLPLASIGYQRLTFQATYIPGTYNNGNVFFARLRWQF